MAFFAGTLIVVPAALPPAAALIAGTAAGIALPIQPHLAASLLPPLAVAAAFAWWRRADRIATTLIAIAFACAGVALGAHAGENAIHTPLRLQLDREFGGFEIGSLDVPGEHGPIASRLRVTEDAAPTGNATTLRADVLAVHLHDTWIDSGGGIVISVGGSASPERMAEWRRGRTIEAPVSFRRPARYLDAGVPDFERQDALDGVTLLGTIKSGLLIDVVQAGSVLTEIAAAARAFVRGRIERRVAPHSAVSAAIVSAVLIGDRSGLPDEVRTRLQAAGTYHVIAISGGNIAILGGVIIVALAATGSSGRRAAVVTLILLVAYAGVVTAGPSVWRATLVAVVYLVARLLDHRTAPWQAMAVAGALLACAAPLDVRNAGFVLTFGATAALLEVARRLSLSWATDAQSHKGKTFISVCLSLCGRWLVTSVMASASVEIALLPVMAATFSRVTIAGLVLNLWAVPLMAVVQIAGMLVVFADSIDAIARLAAWIAHLAAAGIVESARLVNLLPWLTRRVPAPSPLVVVTYYAGVAMALVNRRRLARAVGAAGVAAAGLVIVAGGNPLASHDNPESLRLTMFDVGQGDAMALQVPGGTLIVDTGGSPFGNGGFDIGARVVEPALWAIGVRSLAALLLTHGDPDHIGGAAALIDDFRPAAVWQGIPVPRASALQRVLARAVEAHARIDERRAGEAFTFGAARILVLHPPSPDWQRQRVRNDDSVVLEVLYGDVAILLAGDIGSDVEREIAARLVPAKTRILKVAHHGSRTSTSQALLDAWRPQIALISCGRGNTFGHPVPEVVTRLQATGARIYRTDRDGEITVDTDGEHVFVKTFTGEKQ